MIAGVTIQSACWTAFWVNKPQVSTSCDQRLRVIIATRSSGHCSAGVVVNRVQTGAAGLH